jgi:flavin-dependent dehydrogenase
MFDVVIVGAGPIGLYLAKLLLKKGLKVDIFDAAQKPGLKPCSGLVSDRFFNFVKTKIEKRIKGVIVYVGKERVKINKRAFLVDRGTFHSQLANGIDVNWSSAVKEITFKRNFVEINKRIRTKIVVGADGANSFVARYWKIRQKNLTAVLGYVKGSIGNYASVWPIKSGFAWKIPRAERTEYGMLAKNANIEKLKSFFGLKFQKIASAGIPSQPVKSFFYRTLLVGDAAGQVKPWSGGGLVWGMMAAKIAAKTILESFETDNYSEHFYSNYEKGWQNILGQNIKIGLIVRKFLSNLNQNQLEIVLEKLNNIDIDMDFPFTQSAISNHNG